MSSSFSTLAAVGDRVGRHPALFEPTSTEVFDIDWQDGFDLADEIVSLQRSIVVSPRFARPVL